MYKSFAVSAIAGVAVASQIEASTEDAGTAFGQGYADRHWDSCRVDMVSMQTHVQELENHNAVQTSDITDIGTDTTDLRN